MKKLVISLTIIFLLVAGSFGGFLLLKNAQPPSPVGTWWWNDNLNPETYLNFAEKNNVNEIYYCTNNFNEATQNFIKKAKEKNIKVYLLAGDYKWLEDPTKLFEKIDKYLTYQSTHKTAQFSGIHLDIEPHQSPNFHSNRMQLIYALIDLANTLKTTYKTIKFDYDLPFWLHDEITYQNQTKPAYAFMQNIANRVFIMSYRDTSDAILEIAKEEISYAKTHNKQLILCVETNSSEGDNVSFKEEGKQVMQQELAKLKTSLPKNFGIAIHHIKTWFELF